MFKQYNIQKKETLDNYFPNGFQSWQETHYEVVSNITLWLEKADPQAPVQKYYNSVGIGGMYELVENITNSFEDTYKGDEWMELDFFETVEKFTWNFIAKL